MNTIVTVTGPSLSGKSYLEKVLVQSGVGDKVVSTTTRNMRTGEVDGVDYFFCSKEQFLEKDAECQLVERVEFDQNFYGITKEEVERKFKKSGVVVVVVEPQGAAQVKEFADKNGWNCLRVFVSNPYEVIKARFDERFKLDKNASREVYAQRWQSMQTVEKEWRQQMKGAELFFEKFDAETQKEVVSKIKDAVEKSLVSKKKQNRL
jgi:guanylate kinase